MPELPEVETLRRALQLTLPGRTIFDVRVGLPKMFVDAGGGEPADLAGKTISGLRRRAKFLIVDLSEDLALVVHLRLAGQLVHRDPNGVTLAEGGHPVPAFGAPLPHKSTHITLGLDDESNLYLTDIRQFGRVWYVPRRGVKGLLAGAKLGPEPLGRGFTAAVLADRLARRGRAPLKPLLLDQSFIGGVGNIYADEIVFAAGQTPSSRGESFDGAALRRLHRAIRSVLHRAVTEGVAEILNGKARPTRGFPKVHGRADQPCFVCATPIIKTRFGGRGTYTCPTCQPDYP